MGDWNKRRAALRAYFTFGILAGVVLLLKRLLRRWIEWNALVIVAAPIRRDEPEPDERVTARDIIPGDIPLLAHAFGCSAEELTVRLDNGDRGFCAFRDGEPVHMRWVATRPTAIPEVDLWFCPGPGDVYMYHNVTHPKARGQRLWEAVRIAMDNHLAEAGFLRKVGYVRADNHAMWNALRKVPGGVERIGIVRYLRRVGGTAFVWNRIAPPVYATPYDASRREAAISTA